MVWNVTKLVFEIVNAGPWRTLVEILHVVINMLAPANHSCVLCLLTIHELKQHWEYRELKPGITHFAQGSWGS